jgi:hypothetical protein
MKTYEVQYWALENGKSVVKSVKLDVSAYKKAAEKGMTLRQYVRTQAADFDRSKGDVLDQMYANSGLFDQRKFNMPGMTFKEMENEALAADFRRTDGNDTSLGARLLYPQLILETLNTAALRDDGSDIIAKWEGMIAVNRSVNGTKVEQPTIDVTGPEGSRSGRITQLAEPETLISITTGDRSYRIPTNSIGLMISNEAMAETSIDLVTTVLSAQARGERVRRITEMLKAMVLGDEDMGIAPLPVVKANTFDSGISAAGDITKRAYIKWLHSKQKVCDISRVLTDIDTALSVDEGLLPTVTGQDSSKIVTPFSGMNLDITIPSMIPFEADLFGSGLLVGLDPRYAIQRTVNVSAAYDAIEEFVMRKATGFRVDFGETASRLYDEAWSVLSLEV